MKIGLLVGLNVLVVGAGLLAYDVLRGDVPDGGDDGANARLAAQLDGLQERLDDLESRIDGLDRGSDRRTSTRLIQMEERLGALESERAMPSAEEAVAEDPDGTAAAVEAALAARAGDPDAPLAAKELDRVREALEQVEREREVARTEMMLNGMLERLGLSLTDDQKKRLGTELTSFRETAREKMRATRASGGGRDEMMATFDTLRTDLETNLGEFLAASDAAAIANEVGNGPRAIFGGDGPPGGGPGGRGR